MLKTVFLIAISLAEITVIDPLGLIRAKTTTDKAVKIVVEVKGGEANSFNLVSSTGENQQSVTKETAGSKVIFSNVMPGEWRIKSETGTVTNVSITK